MAGEIQLNSTTFATESAGTITVSNVDSATNRQNLGLEIGVDVQSFDADTTKNDVANTFTANQIISVTDNTNAALRVTQLGSGNSLVVEDSSNPDSSPFVVTSDGDVLAGGTSPGLMASTKFYIVRSLISSSNSNTVTDQNSVLNINASIGNTNTEGASSLLCLTGNSGSATTPGRLIKGYGGSGATTYCFEVQHDGDVLNSNNSYGSLSDERLKQDITDALSSWEDIKNIRVRKYRLKSTVEQYQANPNLGEAPYHIGVISQEIEPVCPGLIKQDLLSDGTPDPDAMKYVKYSILYMKSVKVLQEAQLRIESLETVIESQQSQIDALTARIAALETT